MKKGLVAFMLTITFTLPFTAWGDSQDALDDYYKSSRETDQMLNQWKRKSILDNQRRAIEERDWKEMEYQQRRLENQLLQEQIMGQ